MTPRACQTTHAHGEMNTHTPQTGCLHPHAHAHTHTFYITQRLLTCCSLGRKPLCEPSCVWLMRISPNCVESNDFLKCKWFYLFHILCNSPSKSNETAKNIVVVRYLDRLFLFFNYWNIVPLLCLPATMKPRYTLSAGCRPCRQTIVHAKSIWRHFYHDVNRAHWSQQHKSIFN